MGRKADTKVESVNRVELFERAQVRLESEAGSTEHLIFTGPADWSPEQAEQYIDWRIQLVDAEVSKLRQQLDDCIAARKRWLAVTGGRSKLNGNGNGNGNGAA